MKNILDKTEKKYLYNEEGKLYYYSYLFPNGWSEESTLDNNTNQLTYKDSDGYWHERTYDENSKITSYKDSNGKWWERTYDEKGNELTYKNSDGYDDSGIF